MRHILWILVPAFTLLLAGTAGAQPRNKNWTQCTGDTSDDDLIIAGCTAIIQSRDEADVNRAIAFKNRCMAINNTGDHARAIQDCDQAISLNPGDLEVYLFRGHALFN